MSDKDALCQSISEELWSYWPQAEKVPELLLEHARGCAACGSDLRRFEALCKRSTTRKGAPLRWSEVLPESFWRRPDAPVLEPQEPEPRPAHGWAWAPAFAAAAVAGVLLWNRPFRHEQTPLTSSPLSVPLEVLEKVEFLENMEMLEHLDELAPQPEAPQ